MKIAAAYIRVSTDDQIEYSPESQIKAIRDYAKRNDYILPDEYIFMDEGISGKTVGKRPAFMKMIGVAKTKPKPFDAILLWKFSRFARNREDSIIYKSMLRKQLGIEVISISENVGDDKMSVLIEAMIEAMDEYYSINLAEEVKRGMTEKAKRGEPLSIPPFGYKMENKRLVPKNDESEIIKQVFSWFDDGVGMLRIAKNLNAAGVRTHRGNLIENRTVEYWLNNPAYIGKIRWTPTGAINRDYHNENSMIVDGNHEPLIDIDLWKRVQKRMSEQKIKYRKWYKPSDKISHWLVGLIHCGKCGGPVVNCSGYLYCNNRSKGTCTGNGGIKAIIVEEYILSQLEGLINGTVEIDVPKIQNKNINTDIYSSQLKRAEMRLKRVKEAYENGVDTLEEYRENKQNIQREIDNIMTEIKEMQLPEIDNNAAIEKLKKRVEKSLVKLKDSSVSHIEKNTLAREFITDIIKTGDDGREFNIMYRL
ncbi:MAG: recombinase family protein [Clostridia bacterium]|nr:recombinase family protein [Clostridia bacterium]